MVSRKSSTSSHSPMSLTCCAPYLAHQEVARAHFARWNSPPRAPPTPPRDRHCHLRLSRRRTLPNFPVEQGNLGQPNPFVRRVSSFVWSLAFHGGCSAACRSHLGVATSLRVHADMEGMVGTVLTSQLFAQNEHRRFLQEDPAKETACHRRIHSMRFSTTSTRIWRSHSPTS